LRRKTIRMKRKKVQLRSKGRREKREEATEKE
jgi:hypothetical protein